MSAIVVSLFKCIWPGYTNDIAIDSAKNTLKPRGTALYFVQTDKGLLFSQQCIVAAFSCNSHASGGCERLMGERLNAP